MITNNPDLEQYIYNYFYILLFEMITLPLSLFQIDDIKDRVIATIDNAEKLNLLVDNGELVSFRLNGHPSVLPDDAICAINKSIGNIKQKGCFQL